MANNKNDEGYSVEEQERLARKARYDPSKYDGSQKEADELQRRLLEAQMNPCVVLTQRERDLIARIAGRPTP